MSKSHGRGNSICVCGLQINSGFCKHSKTCCTAAETQTQQTFLQKKFSVESWTASYGLPLFPTLRGHCFKLSSRWQINPLLGRQVARKLQFTLTHQLHHLPRFAGHKLGQSWATATANGQREKQTKKQKRASHPRKKSAEQEARSGKLLDLNEEILFLARYMTLSTLSPEPH